MAQTSEQPLKVTEVRWEKKPGNGYLLRQLFDRLLRDPSDLTDEDVTLTMPVESVADQGGGEA